MGQTTIIRKDTSINPLYSAARVIWVILSLVEAAIGLRIILRLIAANSAAGFTDFIYNVSQPLVNPFINVVGNSSVGNGGVIEWFSIIAATVYWLIAWALIGLLTADSAADTRIERL